MPRVGGRVAATSGARSARVQQRSMAMDDTSGFDNFPPGRPAGVNTGGAGKRPSALFGEDMDGAMAVSTAGPVFRRRMRRNPDDDSDMSWRDFIPVVEVSIKVIQITAVNVAEQTFRMCFFLSLHWFDPSVRSKAEGLRARQDHFVPSVAFENNVGEVDIIGSSEVRNGDFPGHMKFIRRYAGTFRSRVSVQDYPFDHQYLNLLVKSRRIDGTKVTLFNPMRFQWQGHRIDAHADWLAEWSLEGVRGANFREVDKNYSYFDQYMIQVEVRRDSLNTNMNSAFVIFVVTLLSNAAFSIEVSDLADRISLDLTAFLTVVAFKWIVSSSLPKVPYMTTLDVYIFLSFVNLFLQGIYFFAVAVAFDVLGCDRADIYSVDSTLGLTNDTAVHPVSGDVNCPGIAVAEWVMTVLSLFFVAGAQLYYIWQYRSVRQRSRSGTSRNGLNLSRPRSKVGHDSGGGRIHPASALLEARPNIRRDRLSLVEKRFNFSYHAPFAPAMSGDSIEPRKYQKTLRSETALTSSSGPEQWQEHKTAARVGDARDTEVDAQAHRKKLLQDEQSYATQAKEKSE